MNSPVMGLVDDGAEAVIRKGHPRRVPEYDFEPRGPLRYLSVFGFVSSINKAACVHSCLFYLLGKGLGREE